MSFNRLNWDACTYQHNLKQSIGAAEYQLNTPRLECHGCFPFDPLTHRTPKYGASLCSNKPLIDVDSELKRITRKASNCPTEDYIPSDNDFCELRSMPDCRTSLPTEVTRLSNPPCTLRCTGWNRWEWLCQNPQAKALVPFDHNISYRTIVKDNHRPCIPSPIDQSLALPPFNQSDEIITYDPSQCMQENKDIPSITWKNCKSLNSYMVS